jgi:hypothetical protein
MVRFIDLLASMIFSLLLRSSTSSSCILLDIFFRFYVKLSRYWPILLLSSSNLKFTSWACCNWFWSLIIFSSWSLFVSSKEIYFSTSYWMSSFFWPDMFVASSNFYLRVRISSSAYSSYFLYSFFILFILFVRS